MENSLVEELFDRISNRTSILSYLFLIIGFVGLGLFLYYKNPFTLTFSLAIIFSSIFFLGYKKIIGQDENIFTLNLSSRTVLLLTISYIIISNLTFFIYHKTGFKRTVTIHGLTLFLYLITCVLIFSNISHKFSLFFITLTGFIHRILIYFTSPTYIGVDVQTHNHWVELISKEGALLPALSETKYYFAPFYHIYNAIGNVFLNTSVRNIMLLMIFILVLIPVLFFFLIGRKLWDKKVGLLAGLMFIGSDFVLRWSQDLGPTSLGLIFSIMIFFIMFNYLQRKSIRYYFIFLLFFIAVIFTHQVSTFITFIGITTYILCVSLIDYSHSFREHFLILVTMPIIVIFDFMRTKYTGPKGELGFFETTLLAIFQSIRGADAEISEVSSAGFEILSVLRVLGSSLVIGLSILGFLYILQSKISRTKKVQFSSIFIAGFVLVSITFGQQLLGTDRLLPWRWFAFFYIFLILVGVIALIPLTRTFNINNKKTVSVFLVILLVIAPFLGIMGGNRYGARDNPILDPNGERYSIYPGENALFLHTARYSSNNTTVLSDHRIKRHLRYHYGLESETIRMGVNNTESILENLNDDALLINRRYLDEPQAMYLLECSGEKIRVQGPIDVEKINPTYRQTVYDSGQDELVLLRPKESQP